MFMTSHFRFNFRLYASQSVKEGLVWLYSISVNDQSMYYLGKIENGRYIEPENFNKLDWHIQKGAQRLYIKLLSGKDVWRY